MQESSDSELESPSEDSESCCQYSSSVTNIYFLFFIYLFKAKLERQEQRQQKLQKQQFLKKKELDFN